MCQRYNSPELKIRYRRAKRFAETSRDNPKQLSRSFVRESSIVNLDQKRKNKSFSALDTFIFDFILSEMI